MSHENMGFRPKYGWSPIWRHQHFVRIVSNFLSMRSLLWTLGFVPLSYSFLKEPRNFTKWIVQMIWNSRFVNIASQYGMHFSPSAILFFSKFLRASQEMFCNLCSQFILANAASIHTCSRFPSCVLLALSWNTINENPSTDKLSWAINYHTCWSATKL